MVGENNIIKGVENVENLVFGWKAPEITIENTSIGTRTVIRVDNIYPKDFLNVGWLFWAPENTTIYDVPEENRCKAYIEYAPNKEINLRIITLLFRDTQTQHAWLRWWKHLAKNAGWINAPSDESVISDFV